MCGIVGYAGKTNVIKNIMTGLKSLEYRGYDSAGIAVFEDDAIKTKKTKGRLADLEEKLKNFLHEKIFRGKVEISVSINNIEEVNENFGRKIGTELIVQIANTHHLAFLIQLPFQAFPLCVFLMHEGLHRQAP